MCLSGQGKRKMGTWRCLISQPAKPGYNQRGRAVWILLPLVKWSFRNHAFFFLFLFWTGAVGFSTGSARWPRVRHRRVGAASSFWRGREKTVLNTSEGDDRWVLWVYFPLHEILYLFFQLFGPAEKTLASICDCAHLLFRTISKYIYQTKFILRMVNAHNNRPSLSNTSLACHNNCNHIFPDVHTCPNTGLCPLEESPKTWLAFAQCWLTKVRWHTGAWITPMVHVIILELKWDLVKHTKIP